MLEGGPLFEGGRLCEGGRLHEGGRLLEGGRLCEGCAYSKHYGTMRSITTWKIKLHVKISEFEAAGKKFKFRLSVLRQIMASTNLFLL